MQKIKFLFLIPYLFPLYHYGLLAQTPSLQKKDVEVIGRGEVNWLSNGISLKDCFTVVNQGCANSFEMTFYAKGKQDENVQIWSGFGYQDRDNRYALGLRGGNNQDLYLCKYQSDANNKMLALEPLDFEIKPGEWYKIKIVFWQGHVRIYLNDEPKPRIVAYDQSFLKNGCPVLGGGWITTEFKDLTVEALSKTKLAFYKKDSVKYSTDLSLEEKEEIRISNRQNYKPYKIAQINNTRTEISLNGDWLFLPDYEVGAGEKPYAIETDDSHWHIMQVPEFWNPVRNWLHLQDSKLPHGGSGLSDNYREKEYNRCNDYTFNHNITKSAWYKLHLRLPRKVKEKRWKLHFDAVSKIAKVYVNGEFVGKHIGMFGDFAFDITKFLIAGNNSIVVQVIARKENSTVDSSKKIAQAVSVEVTKDMVNSLPFGMFRGDEGGIWQGVKLVVTEQVSIEDVYANTNMNGASLDITINNDDSRDKTIEIQNQILDFKTQKLFYKLPKSSGKVIEAGKTITVNLNTGPLSPKTWSPENPNLYKLVTGLFIDGKQVDEVKTTIGFRSVEKKGNQFYLNGKPYWLRGANHPPCGIAPNDDKLANTFFKLMHAGNQMITRSHGCPFTKSWMDAADRQGIGVSYEGSWPWLLIDEIPSKELLQVWKKEMLALVKKYRNHPSLFIWTINNEMYFTMFYHNDPPEKRLKKWKIISELIKEIRELSPNTLISADSGYGRVQGDYEKNLEPHNIDDGDIDDRHVYFNWYNRDFFQVFNGEWAQRIYWSPGANPNRIFFSQEASTGYTNNDDGHYNRKYLFNNYVPQAWVGDWAYEDKNSAYTLQRHAFMTKELYEVIRRTSPETAGVLLFANLCWFKNVYDAEKISPYPIYEAVKKAASPVLISAELFGRNFYSGTTIAPRIYIVNNATNGARIPPSTLSWKIVSNNQVLNAGEHPTPPVAHYDRSWQEYQIELPVDIPKPKTSCKLLLELKTSGQVIAENEYDLLIANKNWLIDDFEINNKKITAFDITGRTYRVLDYLQIPYYKMKDLTEVRTTESDLIIIANLDAENEVPYNWEDVRNICNNGTNVLLIHPGKHLKWLFYDEIESIYERKGRIVNMHIPESGAFNEIEPMELAWWQQEDAEIPYTSRRSFRLKSKKGIKALGTYLRPHTGLGSDRKAYLYEMSGIPLLEIKEKKGILIASEMETNMGTKDPIAAKLLINMIAELLK